MWPEVNEAKTRLSGKSSMRSYREKVERKSRSGPEQAHIKRISRPITCLKQAGSLPMCGWGGVGLLQFINSVTHIV